MITFVVPVKHYENCHSYFTAWKLLENTLASVCNQTDENFDVIVVSNKTLNDFSNHKKIKNVKFIEVDWEPPASSESWQIEKPTDEARCMDHIRKDRGTKFVLALSQIREEENHYVMFVDADDFIHKNLAQYINNSNKDFLKITKGFRLGSNSSFKELLQFYEKCGTCNITKIELLKEEINFAGITTNSSQQDIIQSTEDYYLKRIIGSHRWSFQHFKKKGYSGGVVPFYSAMYNCSHNEQHSNKAKTNTFKDICTDKMLEEFGIKTLSDWSANN